MFTCLKELWNMSLERDSPQVLPRHFQLAFDSGIIFLSPLLLYYKNQKALWSHRKVVIQKINSERQRHEWKIYHDIWNEWISFFSTRWGKTGNMLPWWLIEYSSGCLCWCAFWEPSDCSSRRGSLEWSRTSCGVFDWPCQSHLTAVTSFTIRWRAN